MPGTKIYDPGCTRCARLAQFLTTVRERYPDYHGLPVAPFGPEDARLLVVGLAPGMHGANATGRPFTGDFAGILLYQTLHEFGFASQAAVSSLDDGLELRDCRITNAVKCLPPENKPTGAEINSCNTYLSREIEALPSLQVILALGGVAHRAVLKALGLTMSRYEFGHARSHKVTGGLYLVDSYHCSRYNTQTGRLTEAMFRNVFKKVIKLIN